MKLTEKQKQKKSDLLKNYLTSQKGKTRNQISKHWESYRSKKYSIEKLPIHRKRLAKIKQPEKRKQLSEQYHEQKYIKSAALKYGSLKIQKKIKQKYSQQDFYKFRTKIDLSDLKKVKQLNIDKTVGKIFRDKSKEISYVLIILKIKTEYGSIIYLSEPFNEDYFYTMIYEGKTVIQKVLEKQEALSTSGNKSGEQGKIIGIYVRIIYKRK